MALYQEMFYIYIMLLFAVFGQESVIKSSSPFGVIPTGNCSCGGFSTSTPDENSEPLLAQTPALVVNCNDEGDSTCKSLCLALATAAKAKGPEILCARLQNANELKLSAFYKVCDRRWYYANMTAAEPLCCENSKVKTCSSVKGVINALNSNDKET
ncbi:uncharacterized protein LOC123664001 [Melitaea cinxia]|uniref:uncharacterized protein LOC123664001 n=1 Tax=Melitaea cinxia TaxID=113334 RepID=UPI001E26F650|nr:uncharacterized protein LOC123664001 [Melitaea cinxia]